MKPAKWKWPPVDLQEDVEPPISPILEVKCDVGCWVDFEKIGENNGFIDRLLIYYKNMEEFADNPPETTIDTAEKLARGFTGNPQPYWGHISGDK